MAIQDINNPYEIELNRDNQGNPIAVAKYNEPHIIYDGQIILAQFPSESAAYKVLITGMTEININEEITTINQFKVDYRHGVIYFHSGREGNAINISLYYGRGIKLLFDTRVKVTDENNNWNANTLSQLIDEIATDYRTTEFITDIQTTKAQNVQVVIAKEGTTIPNQYLKLGTWIVVK